MEDDKNNINLLPDDLRGQEGKLKSSKNGDVPVNFHVPQEPSIPKPATPSPVPKPELQPKIEMEDLQPEKKVVVELPRLVKQKKVKPAKQKGPGFLVKLFGQKKKKEGLPLGISKVAPTRTLSEIDNSFSLNKVDQDDDGTIGLSSKNQKQAHFSAAMDVNLIPEGTYLMSNSKIFKSLITPIIISLVIGALPYLGLIGYQQFLKRQSEQLLAELEQGAESFVQYKTLEAEADVLAKKINVSKAIIERHVYWTKVFTILERLTTANVYYKNIVANINGTVTLSAVANSYTSVAKQYLVFQEAVEEIKQVKITGAQGSTLDGDVSFNIILEFEPAVFYSLGSS